MRTDSIDLDEGHPGSSILSFHLGRILPGTKGENDRRAQAVVRQGWTASPEVGYQLPLTVLPIVVDHEFDGRIEHSARRVALARLDDGENRIGQDIGNAVIYQFRATCLDENLPGAIFDDEPPDHDLLSRFHQGAGRKIDELAIGGRGRLRNPKQPCQEHQHRRRAAGQSGQATPHTSPIFNV